MKIKKILNLALTVLVAFALVFSSLVFANAAEVTEVGTAGEFAAAIKDTSITSIKLTADIVSNIDEQKNITRALTIDGDGHTLEGQLFSRNGGDLTIINLIVKCDSAPIQVYGSGNLTMIGGKADRYKETGQAIWADESHSGTIIVKGGAWLYNNSTESSAAFAVGTSNNGKYIFGYCTIQNAGNQGAVDIRKGTATLELGGDEEGPCVLSSANTVLKISTINANVNLDIKSGVEIKSTSAEPAVLLSGNTTVNMTGGRISTSTGNGIEMRAGGTLTVSGDAKFENIGEGNGIYVAPDSSANVVINGGTFSHRGAGSSVKHEGTGTLSITGVTMENTGAGNPVYITDGGVLGRSKTVTLNGSTFIAKNEAMVFDIEDGSAVIVNIEGTENTVVKSSNKQAVSLGYGVEFIDDGNRLAQYNYGLDTPAGPVRVPNLLEIEYNSKNSGNTLVNEFTVTAGKSYQFDINYKALGIVEPAIKLQYHNGSAWTDLTETATNANIAGVHKSVEITLPANARKNGTNVRVIIGDASFKGIGKLTFANTTLKVIEDGEAKGNNLIPNGDFSANNIAENVTVLDGWTKSNNGDMVLNIKKIPNGYFDDKAPSNMVMLSPISKNETALPEFSQGNITLEAGATYQIDFDVKSVYETYLADWSVNVKNTADAWNEIAATATSKNVDGKHFSYTFTMPTDDVAAADNFQIKLVTAVGNGGAIYLSNFAVYKVEAGKTVGYNYVNNGEFKYGRTVQVTANTWGTHMSGWDLNADLLAKSKVEIFAIPKGFFEGTRPSQMVELVHSKVNTKPNITQEVFLEKGATYRFDVDYNTIGTAESWVRIRYANGSGYADIAKISTADTVKGKHISYEFTMPSDARTTDTGNFEVLLGEGSANGKGKVYFSNATIRKVEGGQPTGENILINGDFSFGNTLDVTAENASVQLHGWALNDNILSNVESLKLMSIPNEFFEALKAVTIKDSKGNFTLLETVKSGKTYIFSFENKYSSEVKATPYIEVTTISGIKKVVPTEITEDLNGKYSTTVMFTTPENLVTSKNIRIGLDFASKDIVGTFSNFTLKETNKLLMATGENIILDSRFKTTESIPAYSANTAESVWMFDGEFDTAPEISIVKDDYFDIKNSKVMVVSGRNDSAFQTTNGTGAYFHQAVTLTKGKTYRLSFNSKLAHAGRETDKVGVEVTYKNTRARWVELEATQLPVANEYKEVYVFTAPNDMFTSENVRISIHISSAYVSGYFTNFSLVEIDSEGNAISEEIVVNGDFATGDYYGWTLSGTVNTLAFADMPENFFNKVTPNKPHMLKYTDPTDYVRLEQHLMLNPSTTYEFSFEANHTQFSETAVPEPSVDMFFYREEEGVVKNKNGTFNADAAEPERNQVTVEKSENGSQKWIVKTAENIRTHGNGNIYFRLYMRNASAGFWGEIGIYELDAQGNRVGNNILLNGDWSLGLAGWDLVNGSVTLYNAEKPSEDFLKEILEPEKMVESKGTAQNQTYSSTLTVNAEKNYSFRGKKIDMNGAGVTPEIQYRSVKENGNFVTLPVDFVYSSDRFEFEMNFSIPEDAVIVNGKTEIRAQIINGIKGKGYFTELMLVEDGKYVNLANNFVASSNNYQVIDYDAGVFVFYYDDTKFDDGDWSGELADAAKDATAGEIRGKLVDSSGKPIKNAKITLTPGNKTVKTDANGEFRFTKLELGSYSVFYTDPTGAQLAIYTDLSVFPGTVSVLPTATYLRGDEIQVPIVDDEIDNTEEEPYGALRGYLLDEKGNVVPNARIYIRGNGYAVTNEQGIFEFAKLPVGEFEVYEMLVDGTEVVYRTVKIEAYKGTVIKLAREGAGFNWLLVIIPAIAVVVLASGTMAAILIFKKKKK